ncbi:Glycosyltransferase Family 90 domain containing protein [Chytriomyces hyalinus]|nr:Glycosyltransferase Family 90 domain containing protein [Chytriomyces hyalinus]
MRRNQAILTVLLVFACAPFILVSFTYMGETGRLTVDGRAYADRFNRMPPSGFDQWVRFALERDCDPDPAAYEALYHDLHPWMISGLNESVFHQSNGFRIDKPSSLMTHNGTMDVVTFVVNATYPSGAFLSVSNASVPSFINSALPLLAHAGKLFHFVLNRSAFPRALPADKETPSNSAYKSTSDAVKHNSCFRSTYTKANHRMNHGFFQDPSTFQTENLNLPIFSGSKVECYVDVRFPYDTMPGRSLHVDTIAWGDKREVLFWRGDTSGIRNAVDAPYKQSHRFRLVEWAKAFAKKHPDAVYDSDMSPQDDPASNMNKSPIQVDIGFDAFATNNSVFNKKLQDSYTLKPHTPASYAYQFKYLVVVDSDTLPETLMTYLASNCVVLYSGVFIDFMNWKLKPMVHYVPVQLDLSDLEERMQWLKDHDEKARKINANSKALMRQINTRSYGECYAGLLMLEYASLFNSDNKL